MTDRLEAIVTRLAYTYTDKQDLRAGRYVLVLDRAEKRLRYAWMPAFLLLAGVLWPFFEAIAGAPRELTAFNGLSLVVLIVVLVGQAFHFGQRLEQITLARHLLSEGASRLVLQEAG